MSASQPASPVVLPGFELKHILVTTDFSEYSRSALKQAAAMARLHGSDLFVLHVVSPEPLINSTLEPATWQYEAVLQQSRQAMVAAEKEAIPADVKHEYILETAPLLPALAKVIQDREISLVVLGTHGRTGVRKLILGSVAEQIYRFADCPVMTIGPVIEPKLLSQGRFESILFATDFSAGSKQALSYALGFAQESRARLTLLHVIEEGSLAAMYLRQQLDKNARVQMATMLPPDLNLAQPPELEVAYGYPVEEILSVAKKNQTDLIVLGVHKSSGIGARTSSHLPWTIASTIVCHANCPVLTVRG